MEFLLWLQDEVMVGISLIGVGSGYRIHLIEKKVFDSRRNRYITQRVYHWLPPRGTTEPKQPMGREKRNQLWEGVNELAKATVVLSTWTQAGEHDEALRVYLKARRELLLELLEATGARPGELARLSVSSNEDCYKTQELILVTLKRRRYVERKIKLQPGVAMRLTVFMRKHRAALLKAIQAAGAASEPKDRLFLGIAGTPMSERSMVSEFCRISKAAGLFQYQSYMSMFRHRFITKQVAIHLGIYLSDKNKNKTKEMMTDGDYRTILKKVATMGHGSETSLLHYLNLAWEELGVTDQLEAALAVDTSIESATTQIISLIGLLKQLNGQSPEEVLQDAANVLITMQQELREAVNRARHRR